MWFLYHKYIDVYIHVRVVSKMPYVVMLSLYMYF